MDIRIRVTLKEWKAFRVFQSILRDLDAGQPTWREEYRQKFQNHLETCNETRLWWNGDGLIWGSAYNRIWAQDQVWLLVDKDTWRQLLGVDEDVWAWMFLREIQGRSTDPATQIELSFAEIEDPTDTPADIRHYRLRAWVSGGMATKLRTSGAILTEVAPKKPRDLKEKHYEVQFPRETSFRRDWKPEAELYACQRGRGDQEVCWWHLPNGMIVGAGGCVSDFAEGNVDITYQEGRDYRVQFWRIPLPEKPGRNRTWLETFFPALAVVEERAYAPSSVR